MYNSFPWVLVDPDCENCYSSKATLLRQAVIDWLRKYGRQRGFTEVVNSPNLGGIICLCVGDGMLLYAGKSREDLVPTELDRLSLRNRIEPFASAGYVLTLHFHRLFRQDTYFRYSCKGALRVYLI
ncbi:MAG: hypothetical protein N2Z80_03265 [Hydrogenothermaceae bacterium]|nr:hypothetical protein [Hydrogenothermaceae bacterium]